MIPHKQIIIGDLNFDIAYSNVKHYLFFKSNTSNGIFYKNKKIFFKLTLYYRIISTLEKLMLVN